MTAITEETEAEPHPKTAADGYVALAGYRDAPRERLIEWIEQMAQDFATLNGIHNHTAEQRDWCDEYEGRQESHNEKLTVLKLVGRREELPRGTASAGL